MKVMLKLMQGMQELQKQIVVSKDEGKGEEIETLRFAAELPKLQEWNPETVPIDFADWVVCLHAHMSDLDSTSEEWWDLTLSTAKTWYANHLKLTHTQKLTNFPEATQELKLRKWSRLERRASSLLMAALPDSLKEDVVSSKSVTTMGILAKAMLQYQPGRLSGVKLSGNGDFSVEEVDKVEKESPGSWCLHTRVCMKGSGKLVKRIVANHPDLSFRLSLVKSSLMVDTVSTLDTVTQYSEHLLAELEQMSQQARKKDAAAKGQPKLRKMEETPNTKAEEKVRARGSRMRRWRAERIHVGFFFLKLDASVVVVVHMVMSSTMRNGVGHVAARIILQTVSLEQKIHVREQQRWDQRQLRKILSLPHQRLKSLNSLQRRVTAAALEGRRQ